MPIYEYLCMKCGNRFEKIQKDSATRLIDCPSCGAPEVKRELSTFSSGGIASEATGCFSGG